MTATEPNSAAGDPRLAYIIDDDANIREFISDTLAQLGMSVAAFQDGNDALASLGGRHPSIIFLDVALLQSDALDVIRGLGERGFGGLVQLISGGRPALLEAVKRIGERHRMKLATPLHKPFGRDAIVRLIADIETSDRCRPHDRATTKELPTASSGRQETAAVNRPGCDQSTTKHDVIDRRAAWLLCRTGTQHCALPVEHIIEIMRSMPVEPLAGAPSYLRGLSVIRGQATPVVDLGALIGNHTGEIAQLVTIRTGAVKIALAVRSVLGVTTLDADACDRLPLLLRDAAGASIDAIGIRDAELLFVLNAGRLVPEDVLAGLEAIGDTA